MNEKYNVYLVSDSTGETLDRIFLSLKSQFANFEYEKKEFAFIRTEQQIDKIIKDIDFHRHTNELKKKYKEGEALEEILPYAYALVREASDRVMNMRHFDEQILGGIALHNGKIAEMKTGEGKTLVATLPAYLNALTGNSVHIITVNDYLAKRDCEWMSTLYN